MRCWRGQIEWPDYKAPTPPSKAERFWVKVARGAVGDCWEWQAGRLPNGYGQFDHSTAHRFSLELHLGRELSAAEVADHICRNRACVNPHHLEAVSQAVNVQRGLLPRIAGAMRRAEQEDRTHCKSGHEMTEANTYRPPGQPTWRVCRACKRARAAARYT